MIHPGGAYRPPMPDDPAPTPVHRPRHRLSRDADYRAVYDARIKKAQGPLLIFIRPNELPEHRLGLSVGRRAGGAVVRNRYKRLIREAFRHERPALPTPGPGAAYDIIVGVRTHKVMPLAAYRALLVELVDRCHREYLRRVSRSGAGDG